MSICCITNSESAATRWAKHAGTFEGSFVGYGAQYAGIQIKHLKAENTKIPTRILHLQTFIAILGIIIIFPGPKLVPGLYTISSLG